MSSGMSLAFGKTIGVAAQVYAGEEILVIGVDKNGLALAKDAIRKIRAKLPGSTTLKIETVQTQAQEQVQEDQQEEQVMAVST